MKKIFYPFLIFLSLLSVFLIVQRVVLTARENNNMTLPDIPANLAAPATPKELNVSPAVPILMYHHIQIYPGGDNPSSPTIFVSPASFRAQLDWLVAHNFATVNPSYLLHPTPLAKKPVILTFDDGYQDAFDTIFPILEKYHFQATFFPIVDNIGAGGFLNQAEIMEMKQAGMNFGSHTLTHVDLTQVDATQAAREIYASKIILERITGAPVTDFCYPGGFVNATVENIVANSGYATATTTVNTVNAGSIDPLRLNRLFIQDTTRFDDLPALKNL